MKIKNLVSASVIFFPLFLFTVTGFCAEDGKVTMEQWLKIINSGDANKASEPKTTDTDNKNDVDSSAQPAARSIAVNIYWHMADDADVYLNGKPLRQYTPSFKTRGDEAPQPAFAASAVLRKGDIFTVGGRRGGSFGFMLIAVDSAGRVVFKTDQQSWKVYDPGERADWFDPQVAESSPTSPVTVQPDPWYPQKELNSKYGNKALSLWSTPANRFAYLYGIVGGSRATVKNRTTGDSLEAKGVSGAPRPEGENIPPPGKSGTEVETVMDTKTAPIGTDGGTIVLKDGASLKVAAGALRAPADMTLSKIGNADYFGGGGNLTYEVSKNAFTAGATLSAPLGKGLPADRIAVLQYPLTIPASEDGVPAIPPEFAYNSSTGQVAVTLGVPRNKANKNDKDPAVLFSMDERLRVSVERPYQVPGSKRSVAPIRIPYYQQLGPSCWAADTAMMTGAYGTPARIHTLLKGMNRTDKPDAGWGVSTRELNKIFPAAMTIATGLPFKTALYAGRENLLDAIVGLLDKGYPVLIGLPASFVPKHGAHSVVFVGYEQSSDPRDAGYKFTVMDSKGAVPTTAEDGGMYSVRSWQWFLNWFGLISSNVIAWVDKPAPAVAPSLVSLGMPCGGFDVGEFAFSIPKLDVNPMLIYLTYKPSSNDGTAWGAGTDLYNQIPNAADSISIKLPVWNAGSDVFTGVVKVDFIKEGEKAGGSSFPVTSSPGPNPVYVTGSIPLKDFRGTDDVSNMNPVPLAFTALVTLEDGSGTRIDRFSTDFVLQPGPRVDKVNPDTANPGDTINITGRNFGTIQFTSKVTVSGVDVDADSVVWSDTNIQAKVPASPAPGDVVVNVADLKSNAFELKRTPKISGIAPNTGKPGDPVTINGVNFGAENSANKLSFSGAAATATSWSDTAIETNVPAGAATGDVIVTASGIASSGVLFTVIADKPPAAKDKPADGAGSTAGGVTSGKAEWGAYHLQYTISGAALVTPPAYTNPFGFDIYSYSGKLAGSTLTISGTGWSDNETSNIDFPYALAVSVTVGDKTQKYEYKAPVKEKLNKPFSLSVPIPPDATGGSFSMSVIYYNSTYGNRGVVVGGNLKK